jgi:hypothetical protein
MWKSAERAPSFANYTLAFALQLKKKHGKTSVRIRKTSVRSRKTSVRVQYTYYQNTHTLNAAVKFWILKIVGVFFGLLRKTS